MLRNVSITLLNGVVTDKRKHTASGRYGLIQCIVGGRVGCWQFAPTYGNFIADTDIDGLLDCKDPDIDNDGVLEAFGPDVVNHYLNNARIEQRAFDAAITDWERVRGFERF